MPFSPTDIVGLRCWEADSLVLSDGDPVSTWTDVGAAAITLTAASTVRPTYRAAPSGFNGKPALEFDGSNDMLTSSESPTWGDFTIVVVTKLITNPLPAFARLFDKKYDTGTWLGRSEDGAGAWSNQLAAGVRQASAPYGQAISGLDAATYVITSRRSGTTHGIYLNGRDNSYLKTVTATACSADPYTIGGASGDYANVYIAAVFAAPTALSETDLDALWSYLGTKYSTTAVQPFSPLLRTYYMTSFESKRNGGITLRALTSNDGVTFVGVPVHYQATYDIVPNPMVVLRGTTYVLGHTNADEKANWTNRPQCAIQSFATSPDGRTYTPVYDYDLSATFYQIFAGGWFEESGVLYYLFTANTAPAGNFTPYYIKPTVTDVYTAWDAPVAITGSAFPASFQDPGMFKIGSTYYILAHSTTLLFTSSSPFSGYNTADTTDNGWTVTAIQGDGPRIYQFSSTLWRLYQENSAATTGLEYVELASTWPSATAWTPTSSVNQITGPQNWSASSGAHTKERAGNLILSPVEASSSRPFWTTIGARRVR